jgi:hypothetical protein
VIAVLDQGHLDIGGCHAIRDPKRHFPGYVRIRLPMQQPNFTTEDNGAIQ